MKDHTSHDVVLLCPRCHQISNMHDLQLRECLAIECEAPLPSGIDNVKTVEVPHLKYFSDLDKYSVNHFHSQKNFVLVPGN